MKKESMIYLLEAICCPIYVQVLVLVYQVVYAAVRVPGTLVIIFNLIVVVVPEGLVLTRALLDPQRAPLTAAVNHRLLQAALLPARGTYVVCSVSGV